MKTGKTLCNTIIYLSAVISVLAIFIAVKTHHELSEEKEVNRRLNSELTHLSETDEAFQETKAELDRLETVLNKWEEAACRDGNVRSIAHRGASEEAPENTLPAFRLAKELGFSCVETDIRFTADGIPVCLHNSNVDQTSNGSGEIRKMTLAEIRQYDFGSWKDTKYQGTTIPTFEEFLSLCKNIGLYPYIELKEGSAEQIRSLVDAVNRFGMKGKVTWISFDLDLLSAVRWYDDGARIGYLIDHFESWTINEITSLRSGKNEVFLNSCIYSDQVVEACRKANLPLEVWTINEEELLAGMDPYISGVTSDYLNYGQYLYATAFGQ